MNLVLAYLTDLHDLSCLLYYSWYLESIQPVKECHISKCFVGAS